MTKMRKFLSAAALVGALSLPLAAAAATSMMGGTYGTSGMMGNVNAASADEKAQAAKDEADGKAVWDKLQSKQTDCSSLADGDFDLLGDYFMGLMAGDSVAAMNANMTRAMGADAEKQMHVALGKRLSGCDANAAYAPTSGPAWRYPMTGMMGPWNGGMMGAWQNGDVWTSPRPDANWPMWVFMGVTLVLVWVTLVLAIIALSKWILKQK